MTLFFYVLTMALVTYLIRMLPFTVFQKEIRSPFLQSLLFYLPYGVLSAMTFPAIFYSTGNTISATVGTAVALVLAYFNMPLITVALSAAVTALFIGFLF